jgi:hypothetical protein
MVLIVVRQRSSVTIGERASEQRFSSSHEFGLVVIDEIFHTFSRPAKNLIGELDRKRRQVGDSATCPSFLRPPLPTEEFERSLPSRKVSMAVEITTTSHGSVAPLSILDPEAARINQRC